MAEIIKPGNARRNPEPGALSPMAKGGFMEQITYRRRLPMFSLQNISR